MPKKNTKAQPKNDFQVRATNVLKALNDSAKVNKVMVIPVMRFNRKIKLLDKLLISALQGRGVIMDLELRDLNGRS